MKKLFFLVLALALGTFLCGIVYGQNGKQKTIDGNGNMVTRTVPVRPFTALQACGVFELWLTQDAKEAVRIEADENLQDYFTVRNDRDKLIIDTKKMEGKNVNVRSKKGLKVYVSFKNINSIQLSTIGNVHTDKPLSFADLQLDNRSIGTVDLQLTANKLSLQNKGIGDVRLKGKAENAVVKNRGVGSMEAGSFVVQTMDIDNSGVGAAEVYAEKDLKVKESWTGKVKNKGAAPVRRMGKVVI